MPNYHIFQGTGDGGMKRLTTAAIVAATATEAATKFAVEKQPTEARKVVVIDMAGVSGIQVTPSFQYAGSTVPLAEAL